MRSSPGQHASVRTWCMLPLVAMLLSLVGCTSVTVEPLPAGVKEVAIRDNPKVDVLRDGFHRHGIRTKLIAEQAQAGDDYVVSYVALRSWDIGTYLSKAEIWVSHKGDPAGHAEYHLRNKGGLALNKWAGVESKITPVMDELLVRYPLVTTGSPKP